MTINADNLEFSNQVTIRQDGAGPTVVFRRRDVPGWWPVVVVVGLIAAVLLLLALNTVLWGWVPLWGRVLGWLVLAALMVPAAGVLANRTELTVQQDELVVRRRPLPLRRDQHVALSALQGFDVRPINTSATADGGVQYALYAVLADGRKQYLLGVGESRAAGAELVQAMQLIWG